MTNIKLNISWLVLDKFLKVISGILIIFLVAKSLGPIEFGRYNYILSIISIAAVFAGLGMKDALIRNFIIEDGKVLTTVSVAIWIRILSGFFSFLVVLAIFKLNDKYDAQLVLVASIMSVALMFQFSEIFKYWFESKIWSKYVVIVENTLMIIFLIVKIILIYFNLTLFDLAVVYLIELILQCLILLFIFYKITGFLPVRKINFTFARNIIADSFPLLASSAIIILTIHLDRIIIGEMLGDKALGIFSLASQLFIFAMSFVSVVETSIFPKITKDGGNNETLISRTGRLYFYLNIFQFILMILSFLFSDIFISKIFGPEYIDVPLIVNIFFITSFITSFARAFDFYFRVIKKYKYLFARQLLLIIIHIPVLILLVPVLGVIAAPVASGVSYTIVIIATIFFGTSKFELRCLYRHVLGFRVV